MQASGAAHGWPLVVDHEPSARRCLSDTLGAAGYGGDVARRRVGGDLLRAVALALDMGIPIGIAPSDRFIASPAAGAPCPAREPAAELLIARADREMHRDKAARTSTVQRAHSPGEDS